MSHIWIFKRGREGAKQVETIRRSNRKSEKCELCFKPININHLLMDYYTKKKKELSLEDYSQKKGEIWCKPMRVEKHFGLKM